MRSIAYFNYTYYKYKRIHIYATKPFIKSKIYTSIYDPVIWKQINIIQTAAENEYKKFI